MALKDGGPVGVGAPAGAQNIIYLHTKSSIKDSAAKASDIDALSISDYLEALSFFARRLLAEKDDPKLRHLLIGTLRCSLDCMIIDIVSAEVT